jgi:hypothetical protein
MGGPEDLGTHSREEAEHGDTCVRKEARKQLKTGVRMGNVTTHIPGLFL